MAAALGANAMGWLGSIVWALVLAVTRYAVAL